jgi:hypothetical protein
LFPALGFAPGSPSLLPALETVVPVRWRPHGQNREGLPTGPTSPATNPNAVMPFIVRLLAPPAMTHDGLTAANWTPSRQQLQGERRHPDSGLFSLSGSAIKRIKAGVKARPLNAPPRLNLGAGLHPPVKSARTKKEYLFRTAPAPLRRTRYKGPPPSESARTKPQRAILAGILTLCETAHSISVLSA